MNDKEKDILEYKKNILQEKRKAFSSTLSSHPVAFTTFNTTLIEVLKGNEEISKLKNIAVQAEKDIWELIAYSDELGLHFFQTCLLENLEPLHELVHYVKKAPSKNNTKTLRELRFLRENCNTTLDLSATAMNFFYTQENINKDLFNPEKRAILDKKDFRYQKEVNTHKREKKNNRYDNDDFLSSDVFTDKILEEEYIRGSRAQGVDKLTQTFKNKTVLTSEGYRIPKYKGIKGTFGSNAIGSNAK